MTELSVNTGSGEEAAPTQRVARWWEPLLGALSVATASVVTTITMLHLWTHNLRIPLAYGPTGRVPYAFAGDANFYVMLTKSLIDHGSYLHNSSLGAPYSQTLYDLPHGADNLQFLALRILGWLLRDPVLTVNIWWLTSFALVAATAYVALRCLGVSATVAWVLALLYSLLPYHFARGTAHLLLSSYFMVPIAVLLIVRVLGDAPPLVAPTATGGHRFSVRGRTSLLTLLACAGLASTGPYYALLSLVLLVCAVVVHIRRNGAWNWAPAMSAAAIAMTVGLVLAINLAPSLIYWARHGTNSRVANRPVSDTEVLGLKIARLVEPVDGHRIPALATIAAHGGDSPIPSERGQQLGLIGAVGFVGLVAAGLGTLVSGRRRDAVHEDSDADRAPEAIPLLAGLTLLAVLLGTIGGFAVLLSKVGLSGIRSWNRIS
ncbi:MAG: hypothetical protein JWL70_2417, partial [Acidimicrobiia bacterium]|nr:hypothetical protein [Acidimicrobiia bacterium]